MFFRTDILLNEPVISLSGKTLLLRLLIAELRAANYLSFRFEPH
jgi:hypothetical protein